MQEFPHLIDVQQSRLSDWVTLVARSIRPAAGAPPQTFHSLTQADYVTVLAISEDGRIPLVRQYRPALDRVTTELPGGLLDSGEPPETCAARELFEETGYRATAPLQLLGRLDPDSGRLENGFWTFLAQGVVRDPAWRPERGIDSLTTSREELLEAIRNGEFTMALHIALVGLAVLGGHL